MLVPAIVILVLAAIGTLILKLAVGAGWITAIGVPLVIGGLFYGLTVAGVNTGYLGGSARTVYVCPDGSTRAIEANCPEADAGEPKSEGSQGQSTSARVNTSSGSCESQVGDPSALLGGNGQYWTAPDTYMGAWVYKGASTTLTYPGFGYFDVPGGFYITENVTDGHISFHCDNPPNGVAAASDSSKTPDASPQDTSAGTSAADTALSAVAKDQQSLVTCSAGGNGAVCKATEAVIVTFTDAIAEIDVWEGFSAPAGCSSSTSGGTQTLSCPAGTSIEVDNWTAR
jgi:hypothetical protein